MNIDKIIKEKKIRELFDYENGNLIWKKIPQELFVNKGKRSASYLCNWHNSKYEGSLALNRIDSKGYKFGYIGRKAFRLHRVIWLWHNQEFKNSQIDHINGNRTDNRIENLREVNNQENHRNMKLKVNNTSGTTGVYFSKQSKKWVAQIKVNGIQKRLGAFDILEDAIKIRKDFEIKFKFHENHGKR